MIALTPFSVGLVKPDTGYYVDADTGTLFFYDSLTQTYEATQTQASGGYVACTHQLPTGASGAAAIPQERSCGNCNYLPTDDWKDQANLHDPDEGAYCINSWALGAEGQDQYLLYRADLQMIESSISTGWRMNVTIRYFYGGSDGMLGEVYVESLCLMNIATPRVGFGAPLKVNQCGGVNEYFNVNTIDGAPSGANLFCVRVALYDASASADVYNREKVSVSCSNGPA